MKPHKYKDLIIAWANGAEIEYCDNPNGIWYDTDMPSWFENIEYRIKPQPEFIPFDFSDAKFLIGRVVKLKTKDYIILITAVYKDGINFCKFNELLENYTFFDGSPCGKLKLK